MGSRKDKTSGMACILSDYYSTSGETSFLFIPMYRCKPLSVNELILSLNLLLTAHGKFLLTNAYLQHLEFVSLYTDRKLQSHNRFTE